MALPSLMFPMDVPMLGVALTVPMFFIVCYGLYVVSMSKSKAATTFSHSPRVLIIANRIGEFNGETGGGSIFRQTLLNGLTNANYDVTCFSIGRVDVDYTNSVRGPVMSPSLHNLHLLCRMASQQDLIIVSGSWSFLNVFAVFVSLVLSIPAVTFVTMNSKAAVDSNFTGMRWCLAYLLYTASDHVNCRLSAGAWTRSAEYYRSLRASNVPVRGVVTCGDQYQAFRSHDRADAIAEARLLLSGGDPEKPLLLYCGRLLPEKRVSLLVAAKLEGTVLAIVGSGTGVEAENIRRLHNPANGIVCLADGMVSQERLRLYYKAADVHVSASDFETLGNTVHEALLCGCPVVVQRAGGYMSQVCNGQNGYLVDWACPDEAQHAVASILRGNLTNVTPLRQQADDAMEIIRQFSSASMAQTRLRAAIVSWPAVCFLWLLSLMYDRFAMEQGTEGAHTNARCTRGKACSWP